MTPVVRMQFGSHLYGTSTPASDFDFKAVFIPPGRAILLQRVKDVETAKRAKAMGEKNMAGEVEEEAYALHRFLHLLAEGQTVALDMLFAPPASIFETSPVWQHITENRERLLTKRSAAFVGYCRTQANKYGIKGSRVASARAARDFFARHLASTNSQERIDTIGDLVRSFAAQHEHCDVIEMKQPHGGADLAHLECCNKKVPFTNTIKSAFELYSRVFDEYGQRALAAETGNGIDWKALSHAVRVGHEAIELMTAKHITFPLPNADHILRIKTGQVPYQAVAAEIEALLEALTAAAEVSTLPDEPDRQFIDDLVVEQYRAAASKMPLSDLELAGAGGMR